MIIWDERKAVEELRRAMRSAIPVEDPAHVSARRGRLVAQIEEEIAQVPLRARATETRRKVLHWGVALAAAALVGLSGSYLGTSLLPSTTPSASKVSSSVALPSALSKAAERSGARLAVHTGRFTDPADSLLVGDTLRLKAHQTAQVTLPGGTEMQLSNEGELLLVEAEMFSQQVTISQGRLRVDVREGQTERRRVLVRTPHALVEVKGTLFFVDVRKDTGSTTVSVERGEVLVHVDGENETLLPGESWNSNRVGLSVTTIKNPSPAPSGSARAVAQKQSGPRDRTDAPGSTLKAQNDALERAIVLERQGQGQEADAILTQLLKRYPDSPLRSTIDAERRRLRAQSLAH